MNRIFIPTLTLFFLMLAFFFSQAPAKEPAKENSKKAEKVNAKYAGTETCQACHSEVYEKLEKTAMGALFLKKPRTPAEKLGCETCHGAGTAHADSGGKSFNGLVRFKKASGSSVLAQNEACFKCHQKRGRLFWAGSAHDMKGLACTTCHVVHTGPGVTRRYQLANLTVRDTCLPCHKDQVRAELRFSHHPQREEKMNCASCHNSHGTTSPKLIRELSNRELCFKCHAQYRGPFLFQHPPVMEDCFNCHLPHGSAYPNLLKSPAIRLCRECHVSFHSVNFRPGGRARPNVMVGTACVNCHRNIHGSNNFNGHLFFH
jgi:DmsE family decaheme c-type cytochrome